MFSRRSFFTSTFGAALAGCAVRASKVALGQENNSVACTKDHLATPALLLDLDAFEANLRILADHCRQSGCAFRPHAKTHKCPEIAKRQIDSGAAGICVATVPEAEAMVAAGIQGVLLTSPIVEPAKIARMVQLARSGGNVMLSLGDRHQVELLSSAAQEASTTIDVLIDIDVIDHRTGSLPGEPALQLARLVERSRFLRLQGLQAYAGKASHTVGYEHRREFSREVMSKAVQTRDLLAKSGLETSILSGGSTGTYNIDSDINGITELQVGSYVFMDVDYMRIGGKGGDDVYSDFRPSLTVLSTVVSATHSDIITIDAGVKSFSPSPDPVAKDLEGLIYRRFGDEFGAVTSTSGASLPRLGDRLEWIVPHCDPTVNMYDRLYACRGNNVEEVWPIAARREFTCA